MNEIVIFAGHYRHDPGCVRDGIVEHTYTKIVANEILRMATYDGLPVVTGISSQLWHKIDWLNMTYPHAAGAVEVHFNCANNPAAQGTEVLYHEGSYNGKLLASCIYRQLIYALWKTCHKVKCRGVKTDKQLGRSLGFLSRTMPPAAITESLFLSNDEEREMIVDKKIQDKIAHAHVLGLKDYLLLRGMGTYY